MTAPARALPRLRLLAEADLLLLLAALLAARDEGVLARLSAVAASGDELCGHACPADAAGAAAALRELAAAAALGWPELRLEHARLHEGAIACPINETAYVRREKGPILADIAGFYRAFGLLTDAGTGEKPDHLATELEFVAMLLVLEAQAVETGDEAGREVTVSALRSFVEDHLDAFVGGFCARLEATAGTAFHRLLAGLIARLWDGFLAGRGLARGAAAAPVAPGGDELQFDCGGCGQGGGA